MTDIHFHSNSMFLRALTVVGLFACIVSVKASFSCEPEIDGIKFNLKELAGTHSIVVSHDTPPSITNTTWLFNPCGHIPQDDKNELAKKCPAGSQICGIQQIILEGSDPVISEVIPVSGDFDGSQSGATVTRLKTSGDKQDDGKEGIRVQLTGGKWGDENTELQAYVEFLCADKEQELEFISWDLATLNLQWKTSKACETKRSDPPSDKPDDKDKPKDDNKVPEKSPDGDNDDDNGDSWGWFTWLFIILVLASAGYIIGGAWLNYNRYGLSGVDLLPHSEFFRDLPYLIRDFARKVAGTFAGGSRGGYSAV